MKGDIFHVRQHYSNPVSKETNPLLSQTMACSPYVAGLIRRVRLMVLTLCLSFSVWHVIELNKLARSVEFQIPNTPRGRQTSSTYHNRFSREQARDPRLPQHPPSLPCHKSLVPSFQTMKRASLTNYPGYWDVKTFVVAIPIVYPQVEPILGELTQQGFWLLCLLQHGEPPVSNAYVFGCFSPTRCQISYPWLHTFSGHRLISPSEVHRARSTSSTRPVLLDFLLVVDTKFAFL